MSGTHPPSEAAPPPRLALPWRLAAVLVAALLIWLGMAWLSTHAYPGLPRPARHALNALVVFALAVPLVVAARRHLDRRPWSGLGLTGVRDGWWPLAAGALSWLVPALAGLVLCVALGWVRVTVADPVRTLGAVALLTVLVLVFEALPEELVFRGYLQRNLTTAMAPWLAVAVQALLFTVFGTVLWAVSSGWEAVPGRAGLFLGMGVVLGCLRVIIPSLWGCVGYHLAFQVTAQLLLTSNYAEVDVHGADILTAVSFGGALLLGATVASSLVRSPQNWVRREPDPARG